MPRVYGDTPTFLGCPPAALPEGVEKGQVVLVGVPWEGVTWWSFSGCDLAPKSIRHADAPYGGCLPGYDVNVLDRIMLRDAGDLRVSPGDGEATMAEVRAAAAAVSGGDPLARWGPLHRVIWCPGPRNAPLQMALAREAGAGSSP
jgi:agmatinase